MYQFLPEMERVGKVLIQRITSDKFRETRSLTAALMMVWVLRLAVFDQRQIVSRSMHPTLQVGDFIFLDKASVLWGKRPGRRGETFLKRDDVVVFKPPEISRDMYAQLISETGCDGMEKEQELVLNTKLDYIKQRVVALGGDHVKMHKGYLEVNGERVHGCASIYCCICGTRIWDRGDDGKENHASYEWGPIVVPQDSIVVLGDARDLSFDSHVWGPLPVSHVVGLVAVRYWPLHRMSFFRKPQKSICRRCQAIRL
ncbi:unnamed protein product [Discosporangium mesarthrocarpum]